MTSQTVRMWFRELIYENRYEELKRQLEAGENPNTPHVYCHLTPLHYCSGKSNYARLLLSFGADVDFDASNQESLNMLSDTPLIHMATIGDLELVKTLIYFGNPSKDNLFYARQAAGSRGYKEVRDASYSLTPNGFLISKVVSDFFKDICLKDVSSLIVGYAALELR